MARIILSQQIVRDLLHYDPETGIFTWRYRDRKYSTSDKAYKLFNATFAGKIAGGFDDCGYIKIKILGRLFSAHRLAFLYMTGGFPATEVDHIDRNKTNNRFENLRVVSRAVNIQNNFNPLPSNKLQIRGVRHYLGKKFVARIRANNQCHHLGTFDTAEEAEAAYLAAKAALHPEAVFTLDTA
jgi:hypothetical protein